MARDGRACFNHEDRLAKALCTQCHKALCAECAMETPEGAFCSHECHAKTKAFRATYTGEQKMKGRLVKKVVTVVVVLAVVYVALFVGAKMDCDTCKSILKCVPILPKP